MALQTYSKIVNEPVTSVSEEELERIILNIGDEFDIRIVWNQDTAVMSATGAILGALVGLFAPQQKSVLSTVAGAALGGATGFAVAQAISLRDLWNRIKQELQELYFIVLNYLRGLNPGDVIVAIAFIKTNLSSRAELARTIVSFIAGRVGSQVMSNLS